MRIEQFIDNFLRESNLGKEVSFEIRRKHYSPIKINGLLIEYSDKNTLIFCFTDIEEPAQLIQIEMTTVKSYKEFKILNSLGNVLSYGFIKDRTGNHRIIQNNIRSSSLYDNHLIDRIIKSDIKENGSAASTV